MNRAASIALAPLSGLYEFVVGRRDALYRSGVFKQQRVDAPVISVGNLTVGGTGKTPLVRWIAERLADDGKRVCIVTRGYRRNSKGRVTVSDGSEILATLDEAGDEALMLAESLKTKVAVICDADRVAAAQFAIENFRSDVIILDDGFQHRRIARDLDIVLIDATSPWASGHLLPAGTLREPVSGLKRADCFVVTRAETPTDLDAAREQLQRINSAVPVFSSAIKLTGFRELSDRASAEPGKITLAAFCAVGNPQSFFSLLKHEDFKLNHSQTFRDHHRYSQSDISSLEKAAGSTGAQALITTAKDAVKLRSLKFKLPCYVAEIEIDLQPADRFLQLISRTIEDFKKKG
jgi:tetraacyldisaccharide 4'-kinase